MELYSVILAKLLFLFCILFSLVAEVKPLCFYIYIMELEIFFTLLIHTLTT